MEKFSNGGITLFGGTRFSFPSASKFFFCIFVIHERAGDVVTHLLDAQVVYEYSEVTVVA